ncbi:protein kinase family protein with ARM repeat domain [Striga asiatica]|uniref:Protein kinase family protein with ARM repeat domain n=1 Tax=Striga asiatica TaxID=4170 RepID=A0A5A7PUI3_STRAF|nr:protein kinase family protein with ARM repeat domain [Striga asiatica]
MPLKSAGEDDLVPPENTNYPAGEDDLVPPENTSCPAGEDELSRRRRRPRPAEKTSFPPEKTTSSRLPTSVDLRHLGSRKLESSSLQTLRVLIDSKMREFSFII